MAVSVEMSFYTCSECGGTYGYPQRYKYSDCPFCLMRERNNMEVRIDEKNVELSNQYRTIIGLKGAATRLKNNLKRRKK